MAQSTPPAASHVVLIAEDNGDDVLLIRRAFTKARLMNPLHFVENGDLAIDYLAGRGVYADRETYPLPALLLLDLKLPRKSGFEVLAWVRGEAGLRVLPVIVLTSSRESGDVQKAYAMGANTYLTKPVAFDNLTEVIKTLGL